MHAFKIRGTLRPLVFREGTSPYVLVAAGAEYFLWNGDALTLTRFGADFASDEDFLARMAARAASLIAWVRWRTCRWTTTGSIGDWTRSSARWRGRWTDADREMRSYSTQVRSGFWRDQHGCSLHIQSND
ncbi:hypothetical protein B0H10DRAFT_1961511 [Mycena sp. CBHHK59/15]|nr:hypothetical protein B0H10DRAFT_1961511 [Mycena sp. CBHHK59/15]